MVDGAEGQCCFRWSRRGCELAAKLTSQAVEPHDHRCDSLCAMVSLATPCAPLDGFPFAGLAAPLLPRLQRRRRIDCLCARDGWAGCAGAGATDDDGRSMRCSLESRKREERSRAEWAEAVTSGGATAGRQLGDAGRLPSDAIATLGPGCELRGRRQMGNPTPSFPSQLSHRRRARKNGRD